MSTRLSRYASGITLGLAALCCSTAALAMPTYSSLTIFGDSLSDTGNVFLATGGTQPPAGQPYFNGRYSDGPVWVETLAAGLGLTAQAAPSLAGGNNFAFAGARMSASVQVPSVLAQVAGLWAPNHLLADPNGLYVVVGGGNDLRDGRGAASTAASRQAAADAAAASLSNAVALLASRGARHVLIANVPDLGNTPEAALLGLVANSSDISQRFNAAVAGLEVVLEATFAGLDVDFLDMAGLSNAIRNDALNNNGSVYGITNVTAPCAGFAFSLGAACSTSLFSDALHPSARAHALLGAAALALVVPEPGSLWLVAVAVVGVAVSRRRAAQTPA